MNAFRILFLVIVLAGSVALALARVTPSVVENQTDDALLQAADLESVLVAQMETTTQTRRASAAQLIAADARLRTSLSDTTGAAPSPMSMFRQAVNAVVENPSTSYEVFILSDASGVVLDAISVVDAVANEALASASRTTLAASERRVVHTYFEESGRLFGSVAAPVSDDTGRVTGAVVLIEEYDDAMAATMRSGTDANTAFFVGRTVMGTNVGEIALRDRVDEVVARASDSTVGSPGRLLDRTRVELDDRTVLIAPIRLAEHGVETADDESVIGFSVVTSGPLVPNNLPAVLARFRAFDDGTTQVWIVVGVGLLFYFLALVLLERALAIPISDMSRRIRDNATDNDPRELPAKRYPAWVRDAAEAYNVFLRAYRAQTPSARSKRSSSHSAGHLFMVDNSGGSRPIRLPAGSGSGSGLMRATSASGASTAVFEGVDTVPSDFADPVGLLRIATGQHVVLGESPEPTSGSVAQVASAPESPASPNPAQPTVEETPSFECDDVQPEVAPDKMFEDVNSDGAGAAEAASSDAEPAPEELLAVEPAPDGTAPAPVPADPAAEPAADEVAAPEPAVAEPAAESAAADPVVAEPAAAEFTADESASSEFETSDEPTVAERLSSTELGESKSLATTLGLVPTPAVSAQPTAPEPLPSAGPSTPAVATPAAREPSDTRAGMNEDPDWASLLDEVGAAISGNHVSVSDSAQQTRPVESAREGAPGDTEVSPEEPAPSAATQQTMMGVQFNLDHAESLASGFQRLRGGSTPSGEDAVAEPTAGADASGIDGLFEAISPPGPVQPPEPPSEIEREGQIEEPVASDDPQSSDTVPRVSLDELNRRAQTAGAPSGDQESLLAAAEARLRSLRPAAGAEDEAPGEHRELFQEFVEAKRAGGEDTLRLTYQRFVAKLDRNRTALIARYNCSDVRFEVASRNGKVTLKATPLR